MLPLARGRRRFAGRSPRALVAAAALIALAGCVGGTPPATKAAPTGDAPAAASAPETGARHELNAPFLAEDVDLPTWIERFEGESREIAAARAGIAETLQLRAGMAVADVGAGTGLFLDPLAAAVGPQGQVFAVDIAPAFIEHIRERAAKEGLRQVTTVLCTDRSAGLPPASVDALLVCDTYHHFEHPRDTLASLHEALRPGGLLVVVDFDRVPGRSRDWVLEHVRAGKDAVAAEIEAAGFRLQDQPAVAGLQENYVLRFRRQ
jgi:SAM-dependent methyltransferase